MYAVQPAAWGKFDERGADYSPTINGAYRIASVWLAQYTGEDMVIWKVSGKAPMPWVRVTTDNVSSMVAISA